MATEAEEFEEFKADLNSWMRNAFEFSDGESHILKGGDWGTIVKLHAMVETALNAAIVRELGRDELEGIIAKLDTSNQSTGKVAFAKALRILRKESAVFLQKLSELRNACVHDVRNFKLDIFGLLKVLGEEKGRPILKEINKLVKEKTHPTQGLIVGVFIIMTELRAHDMKCQARDAEMKLLRLGAELFSAQNQSTPKES